MQKITEEIVKICKRPVTVKTRLGWDDNSINIHEAVKRLQDVGVQAVTIHARTRSQMYKGVADWRWIAEIKEREDIHIPIFGNGDIDSPEKALEYKNKYGVDGMMIGRAAIGYPWIFREVKHFFQTGEKLPPPTFQERIETCKKHLDFSIQWKGEKLGIFEMRRHYTSYFKNLPNFKPFRTRLVEAPTYSQVVEILEEISEKYAFSSFTLVEENEQTQAVENIDFCMAL